MDYHVINDWMTQICVLTKSDKHGGFCVAGFNIVTGKYIRLVSSKEAGNDTIPLEYMKDVEPLDVIEVYIKESVPTSPQKENCLVTLSKTPTVIGKMSIEDVLNFIAKNQENYVFFNTNEYLSSEEISKASNSLQVVEVENFTTVSYESVNEFFQVKKIYKCDFEYKGKKYSNISLTDPLCKTEKEINLKKALIVVSIPSIPFKNDRYYKFVAKVFDITNLEKRESENKRAIQIKQEGFFYSVSGNDALIFANKFGYKLYGKKVPKTGFPVVALNEFLKKLDNLEINYDVYSSSKQLITQKRFDNNKYEYIETMNKVNDVSSKKPSGKELLTRYINVISNISKNINPYTGEIIEGLDDTVAEDLNDLCIYLENKLKNYENKPESNGQKWSEEEDKQVIERYREGIKIAKIANLHKRTKGAIKSRLIYLGEIQK